MSGERGNLLVETLVALALLGIVAVTFLSGITTATNSRLIADEGVTGRILAESQMENVRNQNYTLSYDPVPIPEEYANYSAQI